MKYLLDTNAAVAWANNLHENHADMHAWLKKVGLKNVYFSAFTETSAVRVSMILRKVSATAAEAGVEAMRDAAGGFVTECPSLKLPAWVQGHGQITDAYLMQLAKYHGMELATFDRKIPGAHQIPA